MKIFMGNAVKYNLIILTFFPAAFILAGVLSFFSDSMKMLFFAIPSVLSIIIDSMLSLILSVFAVHKNGTVLNIIGTYPFMFGFFALMLAVNIAASEIYKAGYYKLYKCISFAGHIVWIFILTAMLIYLGTMCLDTIISIIFIMIIYFPIMLIFFRGMKKTSLIKSRVKK